MNRLVETPSWKQLKGNRLDRQQCKQIKGGNSDATDDIVIVDIITT